MAKQTHTPGPWRIHGALLGHKGDVFSPTAEKVTDCHHIARCFAPKPSDPLLSDLDAIYAEREAIAIIEANTRLIAAAPDLLEALKECALHIAQTHNRNLTADEQAALDNARTAIAKAEGGKLIPA